MALVAALAAASSPCFAQQQGQKPSSEDREKKLQEYIDKEVEKLTMLLGLEYWQEFYADSTLNHNLRAIDEEVSSLAAAKVSNPDLYQSIQDKWNEKTYLCFQKFLNDEQWKKYLKTGAAREKKARDKRAEKAAAGNKK